APRGRRAPGRGRLAVRAARASRRRPRRLLAPSRARDPGRVRRLDRRRPRAAGILQGDRAREEGSGGDPGAAEGLTVMGGLGPDAVEALVAAFDLGASGDLSPGAVARGRLGSIWRLDTDRGSWAVKEEDDLIDADLPELLGGAAFQEAALAAGAPGPAPRPAQAAAVLAP